MIVSPVHAPGFAFLVGASLCPPYGSIRVLHQNHPLTRPWNQKGNRPARKELIRFGEVHDPVIKPVLGVQRTAAGWK